MCECTPPSLRRPSRCRLRARPRSMASTSSGCLKNSPLAIITSMRVMSMWMMRPAPMFMWPTSLLPICPSGKPTEGPERLNQRIGKILQQAVVIRFSREGNRVALGFGAIAPAVEYSQYNRFRSFWHWLLEFSRYYFRASAARPGNFAAAPNSSSMRRSWLYLATRSVREAEPVLICPVPMATTKSAMKVSSVSPER